MMFLQAAFLGVGRALCLIFCMHEWVSLWEMEGGGWMGGTRGSWERNQEPHTCPEPHARGQEFYIFVSSLAQQPALMVHAFRS